MSQGQTIWLLGIAAGCIGLYAWCHWPIRCTWCKRQFDTVDERAAHERKKHLS